MALEKELATYQAKLPELHDQEGKFALIAGDKLIDCFGTYEDALKAGYQLFKLEPFLVKQIHASERMQFITRLIDPCHISANH
jgi:hypothetical protein